MAAHRTLHPTVDALLNRADVPAVPVTGLAIDSRHVNPGDAFFALQGGDHHGLEFAGKAVDAGCSCIVFDPAGAPELDASVPMIAVDGLRSRLGEIADRFYAQPSAALDVIGVTGTNGKTTVSWLLANCLDRLGRRSAYAGTLGYGVGSLSVSGGLTTPDVFTAHRRLDEFRSAGAKVAAIEVSSHALDQARVDGVRFAVAVFTNLSRDHLDYHGDMASYEAAKARLFTEHSPTHSVINIDADAGRRLAAKVANATTVSTLPGADASLVIRSVEALPNGYRLAFSSVFGDGNFTLPLFGTFNVENAAAVLATLLVLGIPAPDAAGSLSAVEAPPGRLETIVGRPSAVIDFAHTPDALEVALKALRPNVRGRLWCVFGCGGDRDAGKRPLMAKVAERFADRVVVTTDNPRGEVPASIIGDIVSGFNSLEHVEVLEDRGQAIERALTDAAADDLVLIAGKGHEREQIVGSERIPFSDVEVARLVLDRRAASEEAADA